MTPHEEQQLRLEQKRRDYANTFTPRVELDLGRWPLFRLALRCLFSRRPAYRLTFCGALNRPHPPGQAVLEDLRRLAGVNEGGLVISPITGVVDSHASVYRSALRDMLRRIEMFIGLEEPGGEK